MKSLCLYLLGLVVVYQTIFVDASLPVCLTQPELKEFGPGSQSSVAQLQEILNSVDSAGLAVDGNFGPATKAAVESFQSTNSLDPDGIVGPLTWAALCAAFVVDKRALCEKRPVLERDDGFLSEGTGDLRDEVGELQTILNQVASSGLVVDGLFGSGTEGAVETFQSDNSLDVDGIVGEMTYGVLCPALDALPPNDVCESLPQLELHDGFLSVGKGDLVESVKQLQTLLNANGNSDLVVDGLFGPETKTAVEAVQSSNEITVDGIVGVETWAVLCDDEEDEKSFFEKIWGFLVSIFQFFVDLVSG